MRGRILAFAVMAGVAGVLSACGGSSKSYDISPIFPLSSDKCARYHGDQKGSGITESCMVSKDQCERAAADWQQSMQESGINEGIEFSCE